MRSIRISTEPSFTFTAEVELFPGYSTLSDNRNFDVMPDGERFVALFPEDVEEGATTVLERKNVVLNRFEEVKERVPAR